MIRMLKKAAPYVIVFGVVCSALPYAYTEDFFEADVEKVIEGDKIILRGGTVVQYMGIDAPRTMVPDHVFKDIASAAFEINKQLVEKKRVRLEFASPPNVSHSDSRKFAYVFAGGQMVNAVLLKKGLAVVSKTFPPSAQYQTYFLRAQNEAVARQAGIWGKLNKAASKKKGFQDYAFQ